MGYGTLTSNLGREVLGHYTVPSSNIAVHKQLKWTQLVIVCSPSASPTETRLCVGGWVCAEEVVSPVDIVQGLQIAETSSDISGQSHQLTTREPVV